MTFTPAGVNGVRYSSQGTRFGFVADKFEEMGVTTLLATRGERLLLDEAGAVTGVEAVNEIMNTI